MCLISSVTALQLILWLFLFVNINGNGLIDEFDLAVVDVNRFEAVEEEGKVCETRG